MRPRTRELCIPSFCLWQYNGCCACANSIVTLGPGLTHVLSCLGTNSAGAFLRKTNVTGIRPRTRVLLRYNSPWWTEYTCLQVNLRAHGPCAIFGYWRWQYCQSASFSKRKYWVHGPRPIGVLVICYRSFHWVIARCCVVGGVYAVC